MFVFYCRSTSGIQLAKNLNIPHIKFKRREHTFKRYRGQNTFGGLVVNWGCTPTQLRALTGVAVDWNADISVSTSKQRAFEILKDKVPIPEFKKKWEPGLDGRWLARKDYLSGGEGIEILEAGAQPESPYDFLVKYIPKQHEMRLHVFGDKIIHEQFKYIDAGCGALIRNHAQGARFSAKPLEAHLGDGVAEQCRQIAIKTLECLGLQFGAVDMIITKRNNIFVLEVNTAPGLSEESGTLAAYTEAFQNLMLGLKQER